MGTNNFGRGSDYFITYYANRVISFDDYYYNPDEWESIEEFEEQYYKQLEEQGVVDTLDYEEIREKLDDLNERLEIFKITIENGYYEGFQIIVDFIDYDLFKFEITEDDANWFGFDTIEELEELLNTEYNRIRVFLKELGTEYNLLR